LADEKYPVSLDGWIKCGWNTVRERTEDLYRGVALLVGYQFMLFAISLIPVGIYIAILIQISAGIVISVGWLHYCLRIVRGEQVKPVDILDSFNHFFQCWGVSMFLSILVSVGFLLLIIPGIYIMVRYGFSLFAVMDQKLPVTDSFKFSEKITYGYGLPLAAFYIISMIAFYLVSLIYLNRGDMVGMLVIFAFHLLVTPVISMIFASAYDSVMCAWEYLNLDEAV